MAERCRELKEQGRERWVRERGEACDPGPTAGQPESGCSADCASAEVCGNGIVDPGDTLRYTIRAVHDKDVDFVMDNLKAENLNLAPFVVRDVVARRSAFGETKNLLEVTLFLAIYEIAKPEVRIPAFNLYYFVHESGFEKQAEAQASTVVVPATRVGLRSTLAGENLRLRETKETAPVGPQNWIVPLVLGLAGFAFVGVQSAGRLWRNVRTGYGDRRGARRLAIAVCSCRAQTKNVIRCNGIRNRIGPPTPVAMQSATTHASIGIARATRRGGRRGAGVKAKTNDNRYSASGTAHSSGTEAMSVDRYVVTPSRRLDGTNDRRRPRRPLREFGCSHGQRAVGFGEVRRRVPSAEC